MRAEVLSVGTELLLGQVVDTNSSFIGEKLAEAGIDCYLQSKVGDNLGRIVSALEVSLGRSDAVICCGGLGPTQDDITREAIARVMGVELLRDETVLERIRRLFETRGREMAESNARQADVPLGAEVIEQRIGTAPGLICPVGSQGEKVIYALPGVPYELEEMMERAVLPDLRRRGGVSGVIQSRTLRTWGLAESTLAEMLDGRIRHLQRGGNGVPTLAFLASGIEGIKVRITVKASSADQAMEALDGEEAKVRSILGDRVFGVDEETMEHTVGSLLSDLGCTLAVAESVTGGLIAARVVSVPGASQWFTGGVVSYASTVKHDLLGLPPGPVVSARAACDMAEGVRRLLGSDFGLATTGVAGPDSQEGRPPGTVFVGLALSSSAQESAELRLPGDRERVRQMAVISALDLLRMRLLARSREGGLQPVEEGLSSSAR